MPVRSVVSFADIEIRMRIRSRTIAQEEPKITSIALRPGMVDTPVRDERHTTLL